MSEETIEKHRKRRSTSSVIRTNVNKYLHFIHIKLTKVKKKKNLMVQTLGKEMGLEILLCCWWECQLV